MIESKKIYLWDAANTLFPEKWQHPGFKTYEDFLASRFPDGQYNNLDDEKVCEESYQKEFYKVWPNKGFQELLEWTKNNYVVTTGTVEQTVIRRGKILVSHKFDINDYLSGVVSSFAYHDKPTENAKDEQFWLRMLKEKFDHGYREIIYSDDKVAGVQDFYSAAKKLNFPDLTIRGYNLKNDESGLKQVGSYWEAGTLLDILENEKSIN